MHFRSGFPERGICGFLPYKMAPGSAVVSPLVSHKNLYNIVLRESRDGASGRVVDVYCSEEEAYNAAIQKQVAVFAAIKEKLLEQVKRQQQQNMIDDLREKLKLLQEAMHNYLLQVGEVLTEIFSVEIHCPSTSATAFPEQKRKLLTEMTRDQEARKKMKPTSCGDEGGGGCSPITPMEVIFLSDSASRFW